ncbi:MAG TPA: protein kinase [Pyrinomonadaceae bacterium]|nr:protein kinase [Pyrinomonadaceae bacterium]
MIITAGTKLGRYEIRSQIGAGGMGEVYRARDLEIGRDVAVKVLPKRFSADKDRLQRFQQEACAAGALNHPNILSIYDVGKHDGSPYVVSELLEGETLRNRIAGTPLAQRRAIDYALQIARGLAAAHEKGIIHRDLKPDNIFITNDGRLKILDFGLAKLTHLDGDQAQTDIPTRRIDTDPGVVMGTVGYMSPEQVKGRVVDQCSDIFAFGAILYEMLSGRRAFHGESAAETMSAILKEDPPDLSDTNKTVSPALERLVNHCLEKNPEARFHSARDLGFALEALSGSASGTVAPSSASQPRTWNRERLIWMGTTALLGLIALGAVLIPFVRQPNVDLQTVRFNVTLPAKSSFFWDVETHNLALSPDGRRLAFIATKDGKRLLWLNSFDELSPQPIDGTDGAYSPFWSPDSRYVAFFADGSLKKLDVVGLSVQTICSLSGAIETVGSWGSAGVIVFSDQFNDHGPNAAVSPEASSSAIYRVSANGGVATVLTKSARFKTHWVHFLPDGKRYLFYGRAQSPSESGIYSASLDAPDGTLVLQTAITRLEYAPPGYLLYAREGSLLAQPFDEKNLRVAGEPINLLNHLPFFDKTGWAEFSVAGSTVLAYAKVISSNRLVWLDRTGRELSEVAVLNGNYEVRLSPDDQEVAYSVIDERMGSADIWLQDLSHNTRTRFAAGPTDDANSVWSPDGKRLAYFSCCEAPSTLHIKELNDPGKGQTPLPAGFNSPWDWSHDGKFILYSENPPNTNRDIWVLPLDGEQKPYPLLQGAFNEIYAQFSPDGQWVAYLSNETGNDELYVARFDNPRDRTRVSTAGASQPRWAKDGKELFYLAADNGLMAVPVRTGSKLELGQAVFLFKIDANADNAYDVNAKGDRFLVITTEQTVRSTPFTVILNWTADLRR